MRRRDFLEAAVASPVCGVLNTKQGNWFGGQTNNQWELKTTLVDCIFAWEKANGLHLNSLRNGVTGYEWAHAGPYGFAFASANHAVEGLGPNSGFEFRGVRHRLSKAGARELRLRFVHQAPDLELLLFYTSFPDSAVIEQHCRIRNVGGESVPGVRRFDPLFLDLRVPSSQLHVRACRIDRYAIERLPITGNLEVGASASRPPKGCSGFVVLENSSAQELLFFGVQWGAGWTIRFEEHPNGVQVSGGLTEIVHDLLPGTMLESPRIFTGVIHGDLDRASQTMQVFLEKNVFPPKLRDFPWVVYDVYGTLAKGYEEALLEEIDFAATLGIEVFYHDAAWYAGSAIDGTGNWFTGLGTYEQDRRKFPQGLSYLSSRVHKSGMKFGLWVDCAMVDKRLVPGEIPERWLALHDGKELSISYKPYQATITQICLGDPEVVEHIKAQLTRLVSEFHLDWIKWDTSGENGICDRTDHGHQAGDGAFAAERGRYSIWNFLHAEFPELVLEECGGITRQDLGLAPYCRCHWMDDATFPSRHVRENVLAVSFVYPAYYQESWVVREAHNIEEQDPDVLNTMYRSRMIGLFGFGTLYGHFFRERLSRFPKAALEAAQRNIAVYKRYRHLLSENCFHLTPSVGSSQGWQAIEFCKRDRSKAVVLAFRNGSVTCRHILRLRGLDPESQYRVDSANGNPSTTHSGANLKSEGTMLDLSKPTMSEILFLTRV